MPPDFEVVGARSLRQSTYAEFARARPRRVEDGYDSQNTSFEEKIGAVAREGRRVWIGKTFYDGEGLSGVGDIGYIENGRVTFLHVAEAADYSIDTMLVEPSRIWAALVSHPEGADYSGGLLEYDRLTGAVQVFRIPEVINGIARVGDAVFVGTIDGLYAIDETRVTRFRGEPDLNGRTVVRVDRLSREDVARRNR